MSKAFSDAYFGQADAKVPDAARAMKRLAPFKRHLYRFILSLPEGARVLDVGCGSGKTLKFIRAIRPDLKLTGTDLSDLREHLPNEVAFKQGSAEELEKLFGKESFDAVVCQHVIEHLIYPIALMEGIHAVLAPAGRVFIETPNWTRMFAPFSHFYFWNDYTHVRIFSPFAMRRLLSDYGFRINAVLTVSSCTWFTQPQEEGAPKSISSVSQERSGLFSRVLARLLNPLMRDVLIGIATKA